MIIIECYYIEPHEHEYPDDWILGVGYHPGADPRFQPTNYMYYDQTMTHLHTTSMPTCDEEALDYFLTVAEYGDDFVPYYIMARRPGESKAEAILWWYDKAKDAIFPY